MTLLAQPELARALFEEGGDALFLLDPETDRLVEVNPVAVRLTGYSRAELLGFPATDLFRVDAPGGLHRLRGAFTKTTVFHSQDGFLLRTRDPGAWVPVNLTVSRLHVPPRTLGLIVARDDRDRRTALAQARRVEGELRKVLASSPAALWSAERPPGPDPLRGWQFRYVSPQLGRIAGRPADFPADPLGWADAVHPADRDGYRGWVRRVLAGPDPGGERVYRVAGPDGAVRWVRDRLQVVRDPAGRPERLDGCLTDVTAERQAEDAVRANERRFRALVEKSRDGIVLLDDRGTVRYASPAVRAILGYDPAAVLGRDALGFVPPDTLPAARARLAEVFARPGEDVYTRLRVVAADGSVRVVEVNGANRLADPAVRAVVLNYRDVTAEDRATRALADQNALLAGLFSSVPDVICYTDRGLRFLGGNPAFEALAGRPLADVVGRTCAEVFDAPWAARVRAVEREVMRTGQTAHTRERVDYPGGRAAHLDVAVAPLRGDDGAPAGVIVTARDLTEHERLAEDLRQAQKMEAIGRLAGGIAHDFNNLLTVVIGNLELVRSAPADPADRADLLAAAERAARQAADLTRQMLGFARRQPLRPAPVDLNALVRDALHLLRRSIDPRIEISLAAAPGLPPAVVDPVQVQQVLMNLALNARDAMPDGGTLTVETATTAARPPAGDPPPGPAGFVRLSVADTGRGMTDEVRTRVFEPFFTTKDVGKGTGLGLAVVYGVAKAHGGWVECNSRPGAGSRFDVYLPAGTPEPAGEPEADPAAPAGAGETVLVADDEVGVRELARQALELHGFRVLLAGDGAEAVDVFRREGDAVRAVVLDATMPRLTGPQAFAAIRDLDPAVPVLFASGYPAAYFGLSDAAPGVAFLNKPYSPVELAAQVRRLLDAAAAP